MSFQCQPGEIFGLLGENGAGKTTTLRIMATMLKPDTGTITMHGYDVVRNQQNVRGLLGVLSADTGLYDRMTPAAIFAYFGQLYGMSRKQISSRTEEVTEILGLHDYLHRRTAGFSKGMQQKVNIARAIFHDPQVLLFDEPTSGLDVMSSKVSKNLSASAGTRAKRLSSPATTCTRSSSSVIPLALFKG